MADFILKPPTQQDMQERQLDDEFGGFTKPFTLEVDPKDQTPPVPITATAEKLPARLKEKPETSVEHLASPELILETKRVRVTVNSKLPAFTHFSFLIFICHFDFASSQFGID